MNPAIGQAAQVKGLWINAGHGHLGWTLACGSGRVAADLITGQKPQIQVPAPQGAVIAAAA